MTLQASGAISLFNIRDELGLTGAFNIQSTAARDLAGIPTGSISLFDFYGLSSIPTVSMPGTILVNSFVISPAIGYSGVQLENDADISTRKNAAGYIDVNDWTDDKAGTISSNYEVKTSYTGDAPSGAATNTWLSLGTSRFWYIQTTGGFSSYSTVLTIIVREIANTANTNTMTVNLNTDSEI